MLSASVLLEKPVMFCKVQLPYPLHSGQPQILYEKHRGRRKSHQVSTIEDTALARLLVKLKKPLRITDAKLVLDHEAFQE
jgi:hypothetical protein